VAPGATAIADVVVHERASVSCGHPRTAAGFRVYPPNQYTSLLVPRRVAICWDAPPSTLQIYAFGGGRPYRTRCRERRAIASRGSSEDDRHRSFDRTGIEGGALR